MDGGSSRNWQRFNQKPLNGRTTSLGRSAGKKGKYFLMERKETIGAKQN
jgi:hypothetical protein